MKCSSRLGTKTVWEIEDDHRSDSVEDCKCSTLGGIISSKIRNSHIVCTCLGRESEREREKLGEPRDVAARVVVNALPYLHLGSDHQQGNCLLSCSMATQSQ